MTSAALKTILEEITAKRNERLRAAQIVLDEPELFESLLHLVFEVDNEVSIKAAWVFEFVCFQNLDLLTLHLDYFTSNLKSLKFDSAIRPVAKVCELMGKTYTSKKEAIMKDALTQNHIDHIIEACFDWLIGPYRVAVKAFSMSALFYFGKNKDWVHEELRLILLKDMQKGNPAYCSRGKKILAMINKNN